MRAFFAILFILPRLAWAECTGANLLDDMSEAERAIISTPIPYGHGLTWRATHPDGTQITLVGTMHLPDPRHDAMMDKIRPHLETADLLLVEATHAELAQVERIAFTAPQRIFITDGPTVADMLSAQEWDQLRQMTSQMGIPAPLAAKMQPWFLAISLSIPPCMFTDIMSGQKGLDGMLLDAAITQGIPAQALEDWDTALRLFEAMPIEEQLDMLRMGSTDTNLSEPAFLALRSLYFQENTGGAWMVGRVAAARSLGDVDGNTSFEQLSRAMLSTRNAAWMPVIAQAAQNHDALMIAVGAAHLQGRDGILQGLEQQGWRLERF